LDQDSPDTPNTTHVIVPDWRNHGDSLMISVDEEMTREYDDTSMQPNMGFPHMFTYGDVDGNGSVNVVDAVFLISYIFKGGAAPIPACIGDANGDGSTNVGDAVYLIIMSSKAAPRRWRCVARNRGSAQKKQDMAYRRILLSHKVLHIFAPPAGRY
jgi:hypothetical protein